MENDVNNYFHLETPNAQTQKIGDSIWENKECPICLGNLHNRDDIICLEECDHIFHLPCLYNWLENSKDHSCPYCRTFINIAVKKEEVVESILSLEFIDVSLDELPILIDNNTEDTLESFTLGETRNCTICLDEWNEEQEHVTILHECQHQFHTTCLNQWLNNYGKTCPLCRNEISITLGLTEEAHDSTTEVTITANENDSSDQSRYDPVEDCAFIVKTFMFIGIIAFFCYCFALKSS